MDFCLLFDACANKRFRGGLKAKTRQLDDVDSKYKSYKGQGKRLINSGDQLKVLNLQEFLRW